MEDDALARKTIARMLERLGYEVLRATDGTEGLEIFRERKLVFVVTDMMMPRMSGADLIRVIMDEAPDTRVFAMSGGARHDAADLLAEARRLGACGTPSKPFTVAELKQALGASTGFADWDSTRRHTVASEGTSGEVIQSQRH